LIDIDTLRDAVGLLVRLITYPTTTTTTRSWERGQRW